MVGLRSSPVPTLKKEPQSGRRKNNCCLRLRSLGDLRYVTWMAHHGQSGRIVIDVEPGLKRQFYSALSLSGLTLKDWFIKAAAEYCQEKQQPTFLREVRYGRNRRAKTIAVREEFVQVAGRDVSPDFCGQVEKKHSVVSMFSGCGGMDLGFPGGFDALGRRYRSLPFEIVWANEIGPDACGTTGASRRWGRRFARPE